MGTMNDGKKSHDHRTTPANSEQHPGTLAALVPDASSIQERKSHEAPQQEVGAPPNGEFTGFRRVGGSIPREAWFVACFSGAERFAYYALQAPLRRCFAPSTSLSHAIS